MSGKLPEVGLLDALCKAPSGHRFVRGVWLTHDLDEWTLADSVLTRLCGVGAKAPAVQRRNQTRTFSGCEGLFVLRARQGSAQFGPVLPPWVHVIEVAGRRLHAKVAILQFEKDGATLTRAFAGSANLTRSGLQLNREVVLVETVSPTSTGSLARGLVDALLAFGKSLSTTDVARTNRKDFLGSLRKLDEQIGPSGTGRYRVVHSLDTPRSLLAEAFGAPAGDSSHAVVISPPYAPAESQAAGRALAAYLSPKAAVEIFTQAQPDRTVAFSQGCLDALEAPGRAPALFGVESEDKVNSKCVERMLHAKLIALRFGRRKVTRVLLGSANFTASGLGLNRGASNRELMVLTDLSDVEIDAMMSFPSFKARLAAEPPPIQPDTPTTQLGILAEFLPDKDQRCDGAVWQGDLNVTVPGELEVASLTIAYVGGGSPKTVSPGKQRFSLQDDARVLDVRYDGEPHEVVITVTAPAAFWEAVDLTVAEVDDRRFLDWLKQSQAATSNKPASTKPGRPNSVDDRFSIPIERRLGVAARNRPALAGMPNKMFSRFLSEFAADPTTPMSEPELEVFRALYEGVSGRPLPKRSDPLLVLFAEVAGHQVADK